MNDVVICEPLRTPVGGYLGRLAGLSASDLATVVVREIARRAHLGEDEVDDVVLGNCNPSGEFPALGRVVALDAGLGIGVPGLQVDSRCGSGLQAVLYAAMQVASGAATLVIAGGAESMSRVEHYALLRQGVRGDGVALADRLARARQTAGGRHHPIPGGMIETAENLRREYGISREAQDGLALASHRKAARAQAAGRFRAELVPVQVTGLRGEVTVVDTDEHIRPDASAGALAKLRPIMGKSDPEATVTAGNASGQNDAAAACIVTSSAQAERRGLTPLLRLRSWAVAGVGPERMGISLGHPVGATGARILATMAHELRRTGGRHALETMCIGGGQGLAAVFERVA